MNASGVVELASGVLVVVGALVVLSGGVGLLRLPDFYTRAHADTGVGATATGCSRCCWGSRRWHSPS